MFEAITSIKISHQVYSCVREADNTEDPYAVAVICDSEIVGHAPRRISAACALFLQRSGTIHCRITGSRRYSVDLPQGGLELPCTYTFSGEDKLISKVKKLLMPSVDKLTSPQKKKPKIIEIRDDICLGSEIKPWLVCRGIQLLDSDIVALHSEQLTDLHVDFAQEILRGQFPSIFGLRSIHLPSTSSYKMPKLSRNSVFLQIVHSRGNHWITISAIGLASSVKVYDSFYSTIDEETKKLCAKLFGVDRKIEIGACTQQEGYIDCGVHAIATCTAIAHGKPPIFSREGMRDHLISCFERLSMPPFF